MHSCPVCDAACFCGGDLEDSDVGDEEAVDGCDHCDSEGEGQARDEGVEIEDGFYDAEL